MTTLAPHGPLPVPITRWDHAVHAFLVDCFEALPTHGTVAGYHLVDDRWPDLSEAGRLARLAMYERHRAAVSAPRTRTCQRTSAWIERSCWSCWGSSGSATRSSGDEAWDPLSIVYLAGSGLFGLLSREYAPWAERGAAFAARVEGLATLLDDAIAGLTGLPDRPVSLLHLDTALAQLSGIDGLVAEGLAEARRRAEAGEAPGLVDRLASGQVLATAAVGRFRAALDDVVRARAEGEGRLGPRLYAAKLRLTLSSDLAPEELLRRAWQDHAAVRGEMLRLSRELWATWVPDTPMPDVAPGDTDGEDLLVRRVLDAIADEHRDPADLLDLCRAEVARIEDFCRRHGLITLADEPLSIIWTPVFMRAYGRAFLDSPGPLDRGQQSHFLITPPADDATLDEIASYMREDNDRMLRLLCIHEGVPGHYLQLAVSNRSPSLVRTVFGDGMFAEGWAVYITQVMMDAGYGADDPALLLTHWKFYLRAITNAILDVETHAGDMTDDVAIDLMTRRSFQEHDEAHAKWLRARLTSTQLSTYYVGALGMSDLEVEARVRAAIAVGGTAADVPPQRSRAASARAPASTSGRTSIRSSPTARRPSAGSAGSWPRTASLDRATWWAARRRGRHRVAGARPPRRDRRRDARQRGVERSRRGRPAEQVRAGALAHRPALSGHGWRWHSRWGGGPGR